MESENMKTSDEIMMDWLIDKPVTTKDELIKKCEKKIFKANYYLETTKTTVQLDKGFLPGTI